MKVTGVKLTLSCNNNVLKVLKMLCCLLNGSDMQIKKLLALYSGTGLKSLPNTWFQLVVHWASRMLWTHPQDHDTPS